MKRPAVVAVVVAVASVVLAVSLYVSRAKGPSASPASSGSPPPSGAPATKPTIVFILTDDQRWDALARMPTVRQRLLERGVDFSNAFVVDPMCCPSRASILTGQYPHTTGVWSNKGRYGGFPVFRDGATVATWLRAAGYRTGLFGKYLNHYGGRYVPPGWDRWVAIAGAANPYDLYYDYTLNVDGKLHSYGTAPSAYSTDVLADQAVAFIKHSSGPLFVYFAPYGPHTPATPAERDMNAFPHIPPYRPPSFNEADVRDKPAWIRRKPRFSADQTNFVDDLRRREAQSLLAVDRAVGRILGALQSTHRIDQALIVYTSDNGFLLGEHRIVNKAVPYEESIRVPLIVRYDPVVRSPRADPHLVLNLDFAPTFAAAAGVPAPGVQGRSLWPLIDGTSGPWRSDFLIEAYRFARMPSYCGVRTERYAYVLYETGERELYDLRTDPYELRNRIRDPSLASVAASLRDRLRQLCTVRAPLFGASP